MVMTPSQQKTNSLNNKFAAVLDLWVVWLKKGQMESDATTAYKKDKVSIEKCKSSSDFKHYNQTQVSQTLYV